MVYKDKWQCKKCGHKWMRRRKGRIPHCPKCGSVDVKFLNEPDYDYLKSRRGKASGRKLRKFFGSL